MDVLSITKQKGVKKMTLLNIILGVLLFLGVIIALSLHESADISSENE